MPKDLVPASSGSREPTATGSAAEQAYSAIVDLILSRALRPGERTSVNLLAVRLGLGRTPIKEAITRLQTEGVFSVAGRSGTTLCSIGADDTERLFALRRALEDFAVESAVVHVTRDHVRRLRELLREMRATSVSSTVAAPSAARFVRANVAFHATIVSAASNPFLDRLYGQLQLQLQIVTYLAQTGFGSKSAERRQREHEAIARALEARDARLLKKLLRGHAVATELAILKTLSEAQPARFDLRGR